MLGNWRKELYPPASASRLDRVLPYYIDCLKKEVNLGSTVLFSEHLSHWVELPLEREWHHSDQSALTITTNTLSETFHGAANDDNTLYYGYPLLCLTAGDENETRLIPVFLQPVSANMQEDTLTLSLSDEPPVLNADFLSAIAHSPEERKQVTHSFFASVGPSERIRALMDILNDLSCMQPQERIDPLLPLTPFVAPSRDGLYNRAIVAVGNDTSFTAGLEKELRQLKDGRDHDHATALDSLFGNTTTMVESPHTLIEVTRLDDAQRSAALCALSNPLTVVSGPPGTGKSQVVTALLCDALITGKSILFASRNHKAVNVVEDRMLELTSTPVLIRAGLRSGRRDLRRAFLEILSSLLQPHAAGSMAELVTAKRRYEKSVQHRGYLHRKLSRIVQRDAPGEETLNGHPRPSHSGDHTALYLSTPLPASQSWVSVLRDWCSKVWRRNGSRENPLATCLKVAPVIGEALDQERLNSPRQPQEIPDRMGEALRAADEHLLVNAQRYLRATLAARSASRDDRTRENLSIYRAALERVLDDPRSNVARQLHTQLSSRFNTLLAALPIWSVTSLSVHNAIPLSPGLFDLVIVDEGSQSDIASALPLLYRAKRAIIIGDSQQLQHIASMPIESDHLLQVNHGLTDIQDQRFGFVRNSLFDLAASQASARMHLLSNHYRSHLDLIAFSNSRWYGDALSVETPYNKLVTNENDPTITWVDTKSVADPVETGGIRVVAEIEAIEKTLLKLIAGGFEGSIGVVAPFRAQVAAIQVLISNLDGGWCDDRHLHVATAHGFQGDERDLMIISLCVSNGMTKSAKRFLQETGHLLNVALTRARSHWVIVGSKANCVQTGMDHYDALVEYCAGVQNNLERRLPTLEGPDERVLCKGLQNVGITPIPQFPIDQFRIDLAIITEMINIAIEVDGVDEHTDDGGQRLRKDLIRDARLRSLGWVVLRFWAHQVRTNLDACVATIRDTLDAQNAVDDSHMVHINTQDRSVRIDHCEAEAGMP